MKPWNRNWNVYSVGASHRVERLNLMSVGWIVVSRCGLTMWLVRNELEPQRFRGKLTMASVNCVHCIAEG